MVTGSWLVLVDVAPSRVRDTIDRALRDLGFVEVMPCVYRNAWGDTERQKLLRAVRLAKQRGVGRVLVVRMRPSTLVEV